MQLSSNVPHYYRRPLLLLIGAIQEAYNPNPIFVFQEDYNLDKIKKVLTKNKMDIVPILNQNRKIVDFITWEKVFGNNKKSEEQKLNVPVVIMAGGRGIRQRSNPDRRLPRDSEQNRMAAHPHHPGPYVRATLQRSSRLRNAEKKDTWSNIHVCDNSETVVSHEWSTTDKLFNKVTKCQRPPLHAHFPIDKKRPQIYKVHSMNHNYEQEIRYRLLKVLSQDPNLGQRDMAKRMGISLGKVNYCVSELASKGWIKITRFKSAKNKIPYTYMLTPKGMEEKGRLSLRFLKRKLSEYEEIKKQIRELHYEVKDDGLDNPGSKLNAAVKSII